MPQLNEQEYTFWNNKDMVGYFADKPADPRIFNRLEQIDISSRSKISALDLGCGGGRHSEMLIRMGFPTYSCDINPEMVLHTRKRIQVYKNASGLSSEDTVIPGEILHIPFINNSFDLVVTTGVLHQARTFDEYKKALAELDRVTRPGCLVSLNIFTNAVWDNGYDKVKGEEYSVITKEGLYMTLLPKSIFYALMEENDFKLENELSEDIKQENTGPRAVLRANFVKKL